MTQIRTVDDVLELLRAMRQQESSAYRRASEFHWPSSTSAHGHGVKVLDVLIETITRRRAGSDGEGGT